MTTIDLQAVHAVRLPDLGVLHVAGPDARAFLQGQLSADLNELTGAHALLASCNSAQGRVQAVMWLAARADGVALAMAASVLEAAAARLRKYVLRAKATLDIRRLQAGVASTIAPAELVSARAHVQEGDVSFVHLPGHSQTLVLAPPERLHAPEAEASLVWRRDDVAGGLPHVYAETYEAFVAQMLNLDLLGGISFAKGCYTGQEIIARTHYRGAIKRRMFRFAAACDPPSPGTRVLAGEQHAGDVVHAAPVGEGAELLAVVSLASLEHPLTLETGASLSRADLPYPV